MIEQYNILLLTGLFLVGMVVGGAGVGFIVYQWLTEHEEVDPQDIYDV